MKFKRLISFALVLTMTASFFAPTLSALESQQISPDIESNNLALSNNFKTYEYNGNKYAVIDSSMSWKDAKAFCESYGGHLVTITDESEQTFINSILSDGTKNLYWLGGYIENNKWVWVTGEEFTYSNWGVGEPNNLANAESYIEMYRIDKPYVWNDTTNYTSGGWFYGTANVGIICEWENNTNISTDSSIYKYSIFSANTEKDIDFFGSAADIVGNIYSGKDYSFFGASLKVDGTIDTVGISKITSGLTEVKEYNQQISPLDMPHFGGDIIRAANVSEIYPDTTVFENEHINIGDSIRSNGGLVFSGTDFTGVGCIIANGDITYDVSSINNTNDNKIVMYSENGNIIINGSDTVINGILYAPNGKIIYNGAALTVNGRMFADSIELHCSSLKVNCSESDWDLIFDSVPTVVVEASETEVAQGGEAPVFTVKTTIPEKIDSQYCELNGETVELDENMQFSLPTDTVGEFVFTAYVKTISGKIISDSKTVKVVEPDAEAPVIQISFDKEEYVEKETAVVTVLVTDNVAVDRVEFLYDGVAMPIDENNQVKIENLTAGEHSIVVNAWDTSDNMGTETCKMQVNEKAIPDAEVPVIQISFDKEEYVEKETAVVTISVTDNIAVDREEFLYDGVVMPIDENNQVKIENLTAGEHSIVVNAWDASDNMGTETCKMQVDEKVIPDAEAPVIQISFDKEEYVEEETAVVTVLVTDNVAVDRVEFLFDGVVMPIDENNQVKIENLTTGEHSIVVNAWDTSDNQGNVTCQLPVGEKGDTEPPVISVSFNKETYHDGDDVIITFTATDNVAVDRLECLFNGVPMPIDENNHVTIENVTAEVHQFTFNAWDTSGNKSTKYYHTTVIEVDYTDTEKPWVYANFSKSLYDYLYTGEPLYITPVAFDNSGYVTVTVTANGVEIPIGEDGKAVFIPDTPGMYDIEVAAVDPAGNRSSIVYPWTVRQGADNTKPTLDAYLEPEIPVINEPVKVHITASDNSGSVTVKAAVNGEEISVTGDVAEFTPDRYGDYEVVVTATDKSGNSASKTINFILTGGDTSTPDVSITSPADGDTIYAPTDIIGTVTADGLVYYTLEISPANKNEYEEFARGTSAVSDGVLGKLDTTLLKNGLYNIRLVGYGQAYHTEDIITVSVEGQMKVGNYSVAFQDMDVPVQNWPLTTIRNYDSRDKNIQGDFGYGWDLDLTGVRLEESCAPGEYWEIQQSGGILPKYFLEESRKHIVTINWGNGKTDKFKLVTTPNNSVQPTIYDISITYEPVGNTKSKLEALGKTTGYFNNGSYLFLPDGNMYRPQEYRLTTETGVVYIIDKDKGVKTITDTNGNVITFTENGIIHSSGKSITFDRDSNGRIIKVSGPVGETAYSYDVNGNLASFIDMSGYETKYVYDDNHYLVEIIDDRGVRVARNEYDESGRLIATIDADGNRMEFAHDIDGRVEVVTDRLGYVTVYVYDERGNVVSLTDANGNTTTSTYDSNGNLATRTDALGHTTTYNYDASGKLISLTNAQGQTVENGYDTKGRLITIESMGIMCLTANYDDYGKLSSTRDALGNEISYDYNETGAITGVTDEIGTFMNFTYDDRGNVVAVTNGNGETASFTYDSAGRCTGKTITRTTASGKETLSESYVYDNAGNVTQIINSLGEVIQTEYNSIGKIASATDEKGRKTSYEYDLFGNLVKITYPDNTTETFEYDRESRNTKATDRMGRSVTMTYDKVGNLLSKTYPNGAKVTYTYDAKGRLVSETSASGGTTKYEYDSVDRNTAIVDAHNNRTEFGYNKYSQLSSMKDSKGNTFRYEYDLNGNRTRTIMPDGTSVKTDYDARGRIVKQTDAHGYATAYAYDGADRPISVTDALGGKYSYTYNEVGELVTVTDANGNSTSYAYDKLGRVTKTTNAAGASAYFTYDKSGNVLTATDYAGRTTTYTYDGLDRLVKEEVGGESIDYVYTVDGLLRAVTDSTGTTTFEYDSMNGLICKTLPDGTKIEYSYDKAGRLTELRTPYGNTAYSYDLLDRVVRVVDRNGLATAYEYDGNGNRTAVRYANGIVISYDYDRLNRLIREEIVDKNSNVVAQYIYTLGAGGERLKVDEIGRTVEYSYDKLNRLVSEKVVDGNDVYTTTYTYDSNSNRLTKTANGVATNYSYNSLNQLIWENDIVYTYDVNGNLTAKTSPAENTIYTYDSRNRLIQAVVNGVNTEQYAYDYAGNRTSKTTDGVKVNYLLDTNCAFTQVLAEINADGTLKTYYTRGRELISLERTGETRYYVFDGHGSTRVLVDETGVITDTYNYDAFGNLTGKTGETENDFLYCGEQFDGTTGLYYLRARYMNPQTGMFITMDTYQGSVYDPVSLHKYLYANANPVMYCDPSGHMFVAFASGAYYGIRQDTEDASVKVNLGRKIIKELLGYLGYYANKIAFVAAPVTSIIVNNPAIIEQFANGVLSARDIVQIFKEQITDAFDSIMRAIKNNEPKVDNSGSTSGGGSSSSPDPNRFDKNDILKKINDLSQNKINHILNGSKGSNHAWDKVVPDKNWQDIKNIIAEVMANGTDVPYKDVCSKVLNINGYDVQVVYTIVDGIVRISDAWVNI